MTFTNGGDGTYTVTYNTAGALSLATSAYYLKGSFNGWGTTDAFSKTDNADGSGDLTILDATAIQRVLADYAVKSFNEKAACVTGEDLSILDATMIQRYLADYAIPYHIGDYAK